MTLKIKIDGLKYDEATRVVQSVSQIVTLFENEQTTCSSEDAIYFTFEYEKTEPETVFRGEESTFTRYINGTKKE